LGLSSLHPSVNLRSGVAPMSAPAPLSWHNWANLVAYVINLAVTYGSLTGVFGPTNSELSRKYQTLVTPAGWAFSIWGPIFIWEGFFAGAQMTPWLRDSSVVSSMTGWWLAACVFQVGWTVFFAREIVVASLICMLGILASLLGGILVTDRALPQISIREFWFLRAPFSLHAGWIVAASLLNTNVLADFLKASPGPLLALAVASFATISATVAIFALATPKADTIICLVAAWALAGISTNLQEAEDLRNPDRFNFYDWPQEVLDGIRISALIISIGSLLLAAVATARCFLAPNAAIVKPDEKFSEGVATAGDRLSQDSEALEGVTSARSGDPDQEGSGGRADAWCCRSLVA